MKIFNLEWWLALFNSDKIDPRIKRYQSRSKTQVIILQADHGDPKQYQAGLSSIKYLGNDKYLLQLGWCQIFHANERCPGYYPFKMRDYLFTLDSYALQNINEGQNCELIIPIKLPLPTTITIIDNHHPNYLSSN